MDYTKYEEEIKTLNNEEQEKALALAIHLELDPVTEDETEDLDTFLSQLVSTEYDPNLFEVNKQEYRVLTDEEADEAWEESLDSYIDECILPGLPKQFQQYFDTKKWKSDAKMDGRGHSLNYYDGEEYDEEVNGTTYYIYRTN